jgi:hypothetical protein
MPIIMLVTRYRNDWASAAPSTVHAPRTPEDDAAALAALITRANTNGTTDTTAAASTFATSTRDRRGTRPKVVSVVRCDHSLVTSSIPTMGSRIAAGIRALPRMCWKVRCGGCPARQVTITVITMTVKTPNSSHQPARVSDILRSSIAVRRLMLGPRSAGTDLIGGAGRAVAAIVLIGSPP